MCNLQIFDKTWEVENSEMLRIFRRLGQPWKEDKHKTCSFSGAGHLKLKKIAGQQPTEGFSSENLSVKLLPGHLVLRFIHCHVAMARCSVLTVHIQSTLHPIFMKPMLTWLEWKGWAITFPGNASILCGWIQCSRRSFDRALYCTWGKTASVP